MLIVAIAGLQAMIALSAIMVGSVVNGKNGRNFKS